jgi:hypothetical protein
MQKRLGSWLITLLGLLPAFVPFSIVLFLYLASWRAEAVSGGWPRVYVHDRHLMPQEPVYDFLIEVVGWGANSVCVALFPLGLVTWFLWTRGKRHILPFLLLLVYVFGWLLLLADPHERLAWYRGWN